MTITNFLSRVSLIFLLYPLATTAVVTFPAGPLPSSRAPAAVAYNAANHRAYVVHREFYNATDINAELLSTDRLSVVDADTSSLITAIDLPHTVNGQYQGIAVDPSRNRVFVTNPDDNSLSIIDGNTNGIDATISAGQSPTAIAVDLALSHVYVANQGGVTVFDSATGTQLKTIPLSTGAPRVVAIDPSNHLAYVASSLSPKLVVIDGTALMVTGQVSSVDGILGGPSAIAVDPGYRAYVAFPGANIISVLDISGAAPVETSRFSAGDQPNGLAVDYSSHALYVAVPNDNQIGVYDSSGSNLALVNLRFPTTLAMDPASSRVFVTATLSDSLAVVNTTTKTLSNRLVLGTLDFGLACAPDAARVYAANFAADSISVLDATNNAYVTNWACGPNPWTVAADEVQHQLYTLNGDGTVTVLSSLDGHLKTNLNVGANLRSVLVSSNSHRVFVTSDAGLTVIDSLTNSIITNIVTGAKPVGIAVDEANSRVYVANQMSGQIAVLDAATYLVLAKWQPVRSNVWGLALDTGSHRLYVTVPPPAFGGFNGLEVLNSDTGAFLAEIPTGGITISERTAGLVAVDTRLHYAYMTEPDNNLVYVVQDTNLVATVTVGNSPHGLAVDEAKGLLFVGNALDGTISKIDAAALAPFMITQLARQGAQVIVSWNTQAGATYQLQSKASLSDVAWNTLGLLKTANASSMSATDSFNAASPAFYRVARAGN